MPIDPLPQSTHRLSPTFLLPTQAQRLDVSLKKEALANGLSSVGNTPLGQNNDHSPMALETLDIAPVELWQRVVQYAVASHCPNLRKAHRQLNNLALVSKPLRSIVQEAESKYQFKYMLPILTSIADDLVKGKFLALIIQSGDFSERKETLLSVLSKSDLFGLLSRNMQFNLFEIVMRFRYDDESSKFKAVSYLLKGGRAWLEPGQIQQLEDIRKRIDFGKFFDAIVLPEGNPDDPRFNKYFFRLTEEIKELAATILTESEGGQLQKLFTIAKNIPGLYVTLTLEILSYAMQFLPKEVRNEFFDLTIQMGQAEVQTYQYIISTTIDIYEAVIPNTACLGADQLNILIDFILAYEGKPGYTELWCCLAYAAEHQDGRLRAKLTEAMTTRGKTDTLQGQMLRIDQLSKAQHRCLLSEILAIDDKKEKVAMLGLLGSLMKYMDKEVQTTVLEALLSIDGIVERAESLGPAAISIVALSEENGRLLLDGIRTIEQLYGKTQALRRVVNTVSKNLRRLSQGQGATLAKQ
jgi:hypothetical protein